jgi:hypothetical protein
MRYFLYILAITFFCACQSEKKENQQVVIPTPTGMQGLKQATTTAMPSATPAKTNLIFNPPHGEAGHNCELAEGAPLNQSVPQPAQIQTTPISSTPVAVVNNAAGKLNPKHGEPGHRCDLAVGAPLNSKPIQIAKTVASKAIVSQIATTNVAKGMNPPHGQPNHRCDIAVGAPLNSKPAQPTTISSKPVVTPTAITTTEAQNSIKLNPKHGEAGHRCDIAVGAPLT